MINTQYFVSNLEKYNFICINFYLQAIFNGSNIKIGQI